MIRTDEPRVQRVEEADLAVAQVLLDHHLLVAEVADAGAAVLFVGPHQQVAMLAALAERFAIDVALFAPALGVRPDLLLHEAAIAVAEDVVIVLEDRARRDRGARLHSGDSSNVGAGV